MVNLFSSIFGIIHLISAVWVIYDVWSVNSKLEKNYKIIWTVAAIFFGIFAAIAYYFIEKK